MGFGSLVGVIVGTFVGADVEACVGPVVDGRGGALVGASAVASVGAWVGAVVGTWCGSMGVPVGVSLVRRLAFVLGHESVRDFVGGIIERRDVGARLGP